MGSDFSSIVFGCSFLSFGLPIIGILFLNPLNFDVIEDILLKALFFFGSGGWFLSLFLIFVLVFVFVLVIILVFIFALLLIILFVLIELLLLLLFVLVLLEIIFSFISFFHLF